MFWLQYGTATWMAFVVVAAGLAGRIAKGVWKTMPALALQSLVLVSAYGIIFADLAREPSEPLLADAAKALWWCCFGGLAIAGHETVKKLLESGLTFLGRYIPKLTPERATAIAETILGKLETKTEAAAAPPVRRTTTSMVFALMLALTLTGCAALTNILAKAAHYASYVDDAVTAIERLKNSRPLDEDVDAKLSRAIEITRKTSRALKAASTAATADQAGDVAAREKAVLEAYQEVHGLAQEAGLLEGALGAGDTADAGGIPTPAELEARL